MSGHPVYRFSFRPQPISKKGIDPAVIRSTVAAGGKILVPAGLPRRFPAQAPVTFASTDGTYTVNGVTLQAR